MKYYWIFTIILAIIGGVSVFFIDYKTRYLISDFLGKKIKKTFTRLDKVGSVWLFSVIALFTLGSFIALSFFIQHAVNTGDWSYVTPVIVIFSFFGIFCLFILAYNVRKGNFKIHDKN